MELTNKGFKTLASQGEDNFSWKIDKAFTYIKK